MTVSGIGKGIVGDQVQVSPVDRPGEQLFRESLDTGSHTVHEAGREGEVNEAPQTRVVRRVEVQHVALERLQKPEHPREPAEGPAARGVTTAIDKARTSAQASPKPGSMKPPWKSPAVLHRGMDAPGTTSGTKSRITLASLSRRIRVRPTKP